MNIYNIYDTQIKTGYVGYSKTMKLDAQKTQGLLTTNKDYNYKHKHSYGDCGHM